LHNYKQLDIYRITAIWAFSEAALGGVLHALRFPFTGLFIGSASVLFISLIGINSQSYSQIIRATLIVVIVKALVAPVSPLAAYFSVSLQGVLGYLLFSILGKTKITMVLLGLFSLLLSALQKIILTTILFGMLFWEAIDSFALTVTSQIPLLKEIKSYSASLIIIIIYSVLHIIAGIYAGLTAAKSDKWLSETNDLEILKEIDSTREGEFFSRMNSNKKKVWWKRKSGIIIFLFLVIMILFSIFFPTSTSIQTLDVLFIIIRSLVITYVWFVFISPILVRYFQKYVKKKESENANEVMRITRLFPHFKSIVTFTWKKSENMKGLLRIKNFIRDSFLLLLLTEENTNG
jgi:antibiotic biosynthesis monooxygenase (ABM) superfamily enzyme